MDDSMLQLPKSAVRRILSTASANAAILYLYLESEGTIDRAASELQLPQQQIDLALELLRQLGIIQDHVKHIQPAEHPTFTDSDVASAMQNDRTFSDLLHKIEGMLGKMLNHEDLKILLSIRDYLCLPEDVILILVSYCKERARARGNTRSPAWRSIEKEAYAWADNGIDSMEAASAYLRQQMDKQSKFGSIRRSMQINDRRLTLTEETYIAKWLDMGFGEEEIALAYDRSCLHTGSLNWKYMDAILQSWQSKNLFRVDQIRKNDTVPQKKTNKPQTGNEEIDPMIKKMLKDKHLLEEES